MYSAESSITDRPFYKETPFKELMARRVADILLVCSAYDKFMLEEDGRIDEMLFQEYVSLNLRYPPKFTQVFNANDAFEMLENQHFDLVITMLNIGDINAMNLASRIKSRYPKTPIIVLTPSSARETRLKLKPDNSASIDYIFTWQGNPTIFLAMVKLVEDKMNVEFDVHKVGVQTIILVEDSSRYYSSYLPMIYRTVFRQARCLMTDGLNEWQQTMRMRGRPKILLARTYEEAIKLYETYKLNLLGIITDISYKRNGKTDREAGIKLCAHIREENRELPILLQSSQTDIKKEAEKHRASFIYKHSKTLLREIRDYIRDNYGFGDFVFRNTRTFARISSAHDLWDLQHRLEEIPDDTLAYHVNNNDFSKWLKARALFSLANYLRPKQLSDFKNVQGIREFLIEAIKDFRRQEGRGTIAEFRRERFDEISFFSRIGSGSLGGKGRGLAFVDYQLKHNRLGLKFPGILISIPKTVVISTDIFDQFMDDNRLYEPALSDRYTDEQLLGIFIKARLPEKVREDLLAVLSVLQNHIAVRSSSLLEDSHYQPFAGIYSTYMLPNNQPDINDRFEDLVTAIKGIYASTYYKRSKDYMRATNNLVEEEKMAVIIQDITGARYDNLCYPTAAGVARSLNFYPVETETPEEGIVNIALGLGKSVVDGELSLRFSPRHPKKIMQLSEVSSALKNTQKEFYALDLTRKFIPLPDGQENVVKLDIREAEKHGSLRWIASTYDFENDILRDGTGNPGRRVITFAGILKYNMFPLAEILTTLLQMGREAMNVPIEIEFAVNLDPPEGSPMMFSFLQIRPIVEGAEQEEIVIGDELPENTIIYSRKAMGNGAYGNIRDIIYVKPESFNAAETKRMAGMIGELNTEFSREDRGYILVVPGRLGSSDPWLGIPVTWSQISNARVVVESGLPNFRVDPSQGTHFFQNLTSLQNAYLTINPFIEDGIFNEKILAGMEPVFENDFIRRISFQEPLVIKIDGRSGRGLIHIKENKSTSAVTGQA